nr:unnamed protein product [Spirometra erinaceieuropaei]
MSNCDRLMMNRIDYNEKAQALLDDQQSYKSAPASQAKSTIGQLAGLSSRLRRNNGISVDEWQQIEKEREQKRRGREERIRERRELKGAARLNCLREQQEAELNKQAAAERLQHPSADDGTQCRSGPRPIFASPFSEPRQLTLAGVQDSTSPAPDADAKLNHPSHQQTTKQWTPLGFGTSNLLPHYATGALEDNEDEDDDDEDDLDTEGTDGTFALTLPPGFRLVFVLERCPYNVPSTAVILGQERFRKLQFAVQRYEDSQAAISVGSIGSRPCGAGESVFCSGAVGAHM